MSIELREKQYELDGVVFGLGRPVEVKEDGFTPGSAALRTNDTDRPAGDGIRFGKTRKGSATWGFGLYANGTTEEEAWAAISELSAVWDADDIRTVAGAVMPLRYRLAGQIRRIYGQPRRFTLAPNNLSLAGRIDVVADFTTVDDLVYDDEEQSFDLQIAPPLDDDTGFTVPFITPVSTTPTSGPRSATVTIGGTKPTPMVIEVGGPVAGAHIATECTHEPGDPAAHGGWEAVLADTVIDTDPVTLDARPWAMSVARQSGGAVRVSPRVTRLSKMWLPPGRHDITFTGVDPTGSATIQLRWRNAHRSPR